MSSYLALIFSYLDYGLVQFDVDYVRFFYIFFPTFLVSKEKGERGNGEE